MTRTGCSTRPRGRSAGRCPWPLRPGSSTWADPAPGHRAGRLSRRHADGPQIPGRTAGVINSAAMRVLVTGGAGFIGSHLTDALLARGDEVSVVDDLSAGRAARLDERAVLHKLSVTDGRAADRAGRRRRRPELICHLAAQIDVRASVADPAGDAADQRGRHGERAGGGARWPARGCCSAPPAARCTAGTRRSRRWRTCCRCPSRRTGSPSTAPSSTSACTTGCTAPRTRSLRLANVYGPRQDPTGEAGVITIFCARVLAGEQPTIYGDGTQTRDYVYVGRRGRGVPRRGRPQPPGHLEHRHRRPRSACSAWPR